MKEYKKSQIQSFQTIKLVKEIRGNTTTFQVVYVKHAHI